MQTEEARGRLPGTWSLKARVGKMRSEMLAGVETWSCKTEQAEGKGQKRRWKHVTVCKQRGQGQVCQALRHAPS